jgi:hypothetical protein
MTATIVHRLPVDGRTWLKCHIEGTSEPVDVDAFDAALGLPVEAAPTLPTNRHPDYRTTRRSLLIGAAASLICAPAIVRAASLMPARNLPLQRWSLLGEFYRDCFYHSLDHGLRTGRMIASINGEIVSVVEARRMVAYACTKGWLPPKPKARRTSNGQDRLCLAIPDVIRNAAHEVQINKND